ncbi:aconitate hydratase [Microbacterium sp. RD1]|uniref:aconitate hydratase n=1 Tax=Microbacterium sp. RD1 TaxID=3457313 RepID=UPI003FA592E2
MGQNLTTKILEGHLRSGRPAAGDDVTVKVDQVLIEDATGTMCAMQFEMLEVETIGVDLAVVYIDHNVLQIDDKNMQDHRYLQTFCQRYGLHYSPAGHGISHYIHLERFGVPGALLVGADSHTSMGGALGMFAIGAGGLEVAVAMAGFGFDFVCPRVIGVNLVGQLTGAAEAKDVVLELLRRYGVRGGRGAVFEFFGAGVEHLPVAARGTICNMIVETGASTAIFPSDDQTLRWLRQQGRESDFVALSADSDASYDESITIDLTAVEPLIAVPHSPGDVVAVRELPDTEIVQVCVGSSVNSSYEDLATVASILDGRKVHAGVQLTVTPGSRQILDTILATGVYSTLMKAGARMLEPICGPCVGIGQAPIKKSASLRTFNRNFPGRSGTAEDAVFLCSPSTAAASAIAGRIVDAGELAPLRVPAAPPPDLDIHRTNILPPPREAERAAVVIERGQNLVPPAAPQPLPATVRARVLAVVGDDISTGDMAPDGTIAMSVWSNIAACAPYMFQRVDPRFFERAREWGGGIIVGGENYGQGSSREHAALIPGYLGVRAIVASSYARIHRRNLLAVGIAPLLLPAGAATAQVGQEWVLEELAAAVSGSAHSVRCRTPDGEIELGLDLSPAERATLTAGGLLAQVRGGGRRRVTAG